MNRIKKHLLLSIFFIPQIILAMDQSMAPMDFDPRPYKLEAINLQRYIYQPKDVDKKFLSLATDCAPQEILKIAQDKKQSQENSDSIVNCMLLTGDTGIGKSLLAKAVAFETGYVFLHILLGDILRSHRNETGLLLYKIVEKAQEQFEKVVIVVDDIDILLRAYNNKHHDSDFTTHVLCKILEKNSNNSNFLFIGTAFNPELISPQMMQKFGKNIFNLSVPNDLNRKKILESYLNGMGKEVDIRVYRNIDFLVSKTQGFTPRYLQHLIILARQNSWKREKVDMYCFYMAGKKMQELKSEE